MSKNRQQKVSMEHYVDRNGSTRSRLVFSLDLNLIVTICIVVCSVLGIIYLYRASMAPQPSVVIRDQIIALSHDYLDAVTYESQMEERHGREPISENYDKNDLHMTLAVMLKSISARLARLESIAAHCECLLNSTINKTTRNTDFSKSSPVPKNYRLHR